MYKMSGRRHPVCHVAEDISNSFQLLKRVRNSFWQNQYGLTQNLILNATTTKSAVRVD